MGLYRTLRPVTDGMMAGMDKSAGRYDYLERLRNWRTRKDPDLSMGFLKRMFEREVEKPYKQLASVAGLWESLIPAGLVGHTRLDSLQRGVLHVSVDSSARLYELDRLLRSGVERQLISSHKGPALRRVRLQVDSTATPAAPSAP